MNAKYKTLKKQLDQRIEHKASYLADLTQGIEDRQATIEAEYDKMIEAKNGADLEAYKNSKAIIDNAKSEIEVLEGRLDYCAEHGVFTPADNNRFLEEVTAIQEAALDKLLNCLREDIKRYETIEKELMQIINEGDELLTSYDRNIGHFEKFDKVFGSPHYKRAVPVRAYLEMVTRNRTYADIKANTI